MIAEKTADAIKGRKLTPFEPPTRIAGRMYQQNRMPSANAIYYKTLSQRQQPQQRPPVQQHQQEQFPPPYAQLYYPTHQQQHLHRSSPLDAGNGTALALEEEQRLHQQRLHELEQEILTSAMELQPLINQNPDEFINQKYANSMMASNLMRRVGSK